MLLGTVIIRNDMNYHWNKDCPEKIVKCSGCKDKMKRKQLADHKTTVCTHRIIPCEYEQFGCNVTKIKAKDMKQHLTEYQFQHLSLKFEFNTKLVWFFI